MKDRCSIFMYGHWLYECSIAPCLQAQGCERVCTTGMLMLLDFRDGVCYIASSQNSGCGVACGSVLGAFNSESAQGSFLGGFPR